MDAEDKIQSWIDGLQDFDVWDAICIFYKENEETLTEMNRQQLSLSLTSDGHTIYGLGGNPVFLYRTGDFRHGITITFDSEKIEFISVDPKWANYVPPAEGWNTSMTPLREWYGDTLLGVPENQYDMVSTATADYVSDKFRDIFN
jgi:hypothetical protein